MKTCLAIICLLLTETWSLVAKTTGTVCVAAIQCPSVMGRTVDNLNNITNLVRQAASGGARIVVLPECAVQGYLDPTTWTSWSSSDPGATDVRKVAETVPGPSTLVLSTLAKELRIYLCAGLIESASNVFYNSQVLLNPQGVIVAHHRKKALWTPGDSNWCTPGDLQAQVVDTEYGRIGMMICSDFHVLPPLLAKGGADIVLYSVGWYGPNEENWFGKVFPEKAVIPYGFDVVAANWTSPTEDDQWPGRGYSCIITREGKVLAISRAVCGNEIAFGNLEIRGRNKEVRGDTPFQGLPDWAGKTIGEMITGLGSPTKELSYTVGRAPSKGWNHGIIFSVYPKDKPENWDVVIREYVWDQGNCEVRACCHLVNKDWLVMGAMRIDKSVRS